MLGRYAVPEIQKNAFGVHALGGGGNNKVFEGLAVFASKQNLGAKPPASILPTKTQTSLSRDTTALTNLFSTVKLFLAMECSQILKIDQPSLLSFLFIRLSLRMFAATFLRQKAALDLGFRFLLHILHPCQKHPSTNTASFIFGKMKSGFPGIVATLARHPVSLSFLSMLRTASSVERVPRPFIAAITADRFFFENTSVIYLQNLFNSGEFAFGQNALYVYAKGRSFSVFYFWLPFSDP